MCRNTLMQQIERAFNSTKMSIIRKLHGTHTVFMTADICTANLRIFIGWHHWIEPETLENKSAALACERIRGHHTYETIATKIIEIHCAFQIQGKVTATETDNGSDFVQTFRECVPSSDVEENTDDVQFAYGAAIFDEVQEEQDINFYLMPHQQCAPHTLKLLATNDLDKAASEGPMRKLYRKCHPTPDYSSIWSFSSNEWYTSLR